MSTDNNPSTRFNILVAVVIAALAVVAAFITKFESEASTESGLADSDEQIYYYQAMGAQISGNADTNYEFGTAYQLWYEFDLLYKGALQRGDQETASTYQGLRDAMAETSELLQAPYFDPESGHINLPHYKADRFTTSVVELQEQQRAASDVSSAWGEKSDTYVLQLTLLAVAGFLLGLALMTKMRVARLIFAGSGIPMVAVIAVWAYSLSVANVFDLRQTGAIPNYAQGVSEIDQHNWEAAREKFDQAIKLAGTEHPYANAYIQRAIVNSELGDYAAAVNDYELAIAKDASDSNTKGGLVWALFQQGRFDEAVQRGREALERAPDQLWLRHRVSMVLLASGDVQAAIDEYKLLLDIAETKIAKAKSLGGDGSETLWQLKEASTQLDQLANLLEGDDSSPIMAAIDKPGSIRQAALQLSEQLLSASVALEYNQELAAVKVDASIAPLEFELSKTADDLYVYKVNVRFAFDGLQTGQLLTLKVFRNGVEELAWEFSEPWSQENSGIATITLSPEYADVYAVASGNYDVKMYLNGQLIQQDSFTIANGVEELALEDEQSDDFPDMYDAYDFTYLDIFFTEGYEDYYGYYYDDLFFFEDLSDDWFYSYYEDLWLDYDYEDDGGYWVCDPNFDPECDADYYSTEVACDPDTDSECATDESGYGEYCDPDIDPDCVTDDSYDGEYCDPDIDPDCITDDSYYGDYCDPNIDPDCITDDSYYGEYCDPDIDPECATDDSYYGDYCDPDIDPDCASDDYFYDEPPPDDYYDDPYYDEEPPPDDYYGDPYYDEEGY